MIKEFVPYAEALELKQLGFAEDSFRYYKNEFKLSRVGLFYKDDWLQNVATELKSDFLCLAPTYSQAFRWFREKHQIVCAIDFYNDGDLWEDTMYTVRISEFKHFNTHDSFVQFEYKTYEEAELACLRKLISIVKQKP